MSAHRRKHHIKHNVSMIRLYHEGMVYQIPIKVAEKYKIDKEDYIPADEVFTHINSKYTKPGALLRGVRVRENLTQTEMAKKIKVTQSDVSQMENGTRKIGRVIAKRIQRLFGVNYRSFLE